MIHRMSVMSIVRDTSFSTYKFRSAVFESWFTKSINQNWTTGYRFYCFNINPRDTDGNRLRAVQVFMGPYRRKIGG